MLLEQNPFASLKLASLAFLILCLITAVALSKAIYNVYFHPLAGYPGPVAYRASEIPRLIQEVAGNTVHKWTELHAEYGPVVRIAPGQLSYISNDAWRDIYAAKGTVQSCDLQKTLDSAKAQEQGMSSSGKAHLAKTPKARQMSREEMTFPGDEFEFFGGDAKPMISCDPVNHARHRRVIGSAFSDLAVRAYEPVVMERTTLLLKRLEEHAATRQAVDVVDWFNFAMFDITSTLVFGRRGGGEAGASAGCFGCLERGGYHPWVARVFPGMKLIALSEVVAAVPGLGALVGRLVPRRLVDEAAAHVQVVRDLVERRIAMAEDPAAPDFMTHILKRNEGGGLSRDELYLDAQLLAIAGSETTATLLSAAVHLLSQNPTARARFVAALRAEFKTEADVMRAGAAGSIPYVAAVVNETLRLHPPGAINMPRTVPAGGAVIAGRFVAGGSTVGFAQYAAYRSPTHFTDPLAFVPERWMAGTSAGGVGGEEEEEEASRFAGDSVDVFRPFSYGPRNCVGQNLALLEVRHVIARLYWRFDVEVLAGQESWAVSQKTYLSWVKPPLLVRLRVSNGAS
ncbi:hypothetical protein RB595_009417 [Gaeumannomyces hyphopodioides]